MKFIISASIVLLCSLNVSSQQFYESSGQTEVFTLTEGAKAPTATRRGKVVAKNNMQSEISITSARNGALVVNLFSQRKEVRVSIFDIRGKKVSTDLYRGVSGMSLNVSRFASGMYTMRIVADNQSLSRCIMIRGKGGK